MKLKIFYRKNLNMSPGKLAAQCVHAACALKTDPQMAVIVLGLTDRRFDQMKSNAEVVIRDAGRTEVEPSTETCFALFSP
jgi:peptidyl-tRNA hydrolase